MRVSLLRLFRRFKSKQMSRAISLMRNLEYKSLNECKQLQRDFLFNILDYSIKNVPYYTNVARRKKIQLTKENVFEEINKFPILTKNILKKEFKNLRAKNFSGTYFRNTSGGSTGEPAIFLQDNEYLAHNNAIREFFYNWAGRREGERLIKLWGSQDDILKGSSGIDKFYNKFIQRTLFLNSFEMSEKNMMKYIKSINKYRPKIIEAYAQSIYELAKFTHKNKLKVYSPQSIISSAGTLSEDMRNLIESTFKCKIFNRYGSREVGGIACNCEVSNNLHLNIFNHYVEILNKNMVPCKSGEVGEIYITTFHNHIMPLIRYKIGDMAVVANTPKCKCGRGIYTIKSVIGRTTEHFKKKDDSLVFAGYFRQLLYYLDWIKKYQIIQKRYNLIIYRIVLEKDAPKTDLEKIEKSVKKIMGNKCEVKFEFVKSISPSKSGKFLYTVCEIT
ncbi:phenylacetate--CoA ligase family protein [Candidatus Pacearchaeota archaeon]|nr:phenylacetate--CoA ligase family protein [Candidatus Pacearchaeota archaeon]